ncbi:MAG: malate dehydrogenase (quinone) [Planctomycetia bacterium]|nr:malate dehydrogenase (quinone) [Planctomycetia bacterium]
MNQLEPCDVALVGAGIMSATLGMLLRKLDPSLRIEAFERLDRAAQESSDAWNNAGTGHSGFCELNYTPARPDGTVDCSKALRIADQFAASLAFWHALVDSGDLPPVATFLRRVPHMSFVEGESGVAFLRARHRQLVASPRFRDMAYSEDRGQIADWIPLMMDGRDPAVPVAATRVEQGADVNFGALTRSLFEALQRRPGFALHLHHEVVGFHREAPASAEPSPASASLRQPALWRLDVRDLATGRERTLRTRFLFIGAGGYSLNLLERTGIPEARGYGAFPVSGQWLRCTDPAVIARHHAKVYGQADHGAPPMSVPHLDTRWIAGKQELLFGPYAGITTKFLKQGSWLDLLRSIGIHNARTVLAAGLANLDLTRYLVGQAMLSEADRVAHLRRFIPRAESADWEFQQAGLRVQIIKSDGKGGGELKFGTEVVTSADGSVAALLGASPGASTAVAIMLDVVEKCFEGKWGTKEAKERMARVLPSASMR